MTASRPLRIAHVLTSLSVGGGERMALLLATAQKERGHHVCAVSLEAPVRHGPLTEEFEEAGIEVFAVPKRPTGLDPTLALRILRVFAKERVNVVHTHNPLALIYGAPAGRLVGARVTHTEHGSHDSSPRQRHLRRATAYAVQAFVSVSEATKAFVSDLGVVRESTHRVILNATDLSRFERSAEARTRLRGEWQVPDEGLVIGTVGRMAHVKNHELLLRSAAPLLNRGAATLVFVGDGELRTATEDLARELGVHEQCRFLGEIRNVAAALSGLDVFALSSHSEGLPMALAEAMGASLPVVATAVGGVPKVVTEGETGFLVPAGDAAAMQARFERLEQDRALASALGARGKELAWQRYSLDRMTTDYLRAYVGE